MRKSYILFAVAIIAAITMVSCKNNSKKSQSQKPTPEEVREKKQALADSVLADIDEYAEMYADAASKSFRLQAMELTDEEKMLKPDYLLDASFATNLVTKSQKINALVIYIIEDGVRKIYDMPREEVQEVIAKLAADVNFPFETSYMVGDSPVSDKIRARYNALKERGELSIFWQFESVLIEELDYIICQNPDLFLSKITDEQWREYYVRKSSRIKALEELAKYDDEAAQLMEFRRKYRISTSDEERERLNQTVASAKQSRIANKEKFIARRNALLQ